MKNQIFTIAAIYIFIYDDKMPVPVAVVEQKFACGLNHI